MVKREREREREDIIIFHINPLKQWLRLKRIDGKIWLRVIANIVIIYIIKTSVWLKKKKVLQIRKLNIKKSNINSKTLNYKRIEFVIECPIKGALISHLFYVSNF